VRDLLRRAALRHVPLQYCRVRPVLRGGGRGLPHCWQADGRSGLVTELLQFRASLIARNVTMPDYQQHETGDTGAQPPPLRRHARQVTPRASVGPSESEDPVLVRVRDGLCPVDVATQESLCCLKLVSPGLRAFRVMWFPGRGGWRRGSSGSGCPECPVCGRWFGNLFGIPGSITLEAPNKSCGGCGPRRVRAAEGSARTGRHSAPPANSYIIPYSAYEWKPLVAGMRRTWR
jgi:hypothetical protein